MFVLDLVFTLSFPSIHPANAKGSQPCLSLSIILNCLPFKIDAPDEHMDDTDSQEVPQQDTTVPEPVPERKDENELFKNLAIIESRYKGYEELLQIEGTTDDLEIPAEDDIRGNVKALKHALQHPLVFSDPNDKESNRETYTRHDKVCTLLFDTF